MWREFAAKAKRTSRSYRAGIYLDTLASGRLIYIVKTNGEAKNHSRKHSCVV